MITPDKDEQARENFLKTLSTFNEHERGRLLGIEPTEDLPPLFETAMRLRLTGIAAEIECLANARGQF